MSRKVEGATGAFKLELWMSRIFPLPEATGAAILAVGSAGG
jgi:hypothetical protein